MNERIDELKKQATDYVDSIDSGLGIEEYRKLLDQKFAELIVRECAYQCLSLDDARKIKQHFGVEL